MANEKRLIDANKLNAVLQNMVEHLTENGDALIAACLIQCQEVVERQRTVDAVEVVHAEWIAVDDGVLIGKGTHFECSQCRTWESWGRLSKYCPNCGAKMDGGNEDG